jgi:hypothetical protein
MRKLRAWERDPFYRYVGRPGLVTGYHDQVCKVLMWHRSKALVRFHDGHEAIVPGRCLRRTNKKEKA